MSQQHGPRRRAARRPLPPRPGNVIACRTCDDGRASGIGPPLCPRCREIVGEVLCKRLNDAAIENKVGPFATRLEARREYRDAWADVRLVVAAHRPPPAA